MCLTVNVDLSVECLTRMQAEGGWRTVYKDLALDVEEMENEAGKMEILEVALISPYRGNESFEWEPGWVDADGETPFLTVPWLEIEGGALHVHFNKPEHEYSVAFAQVTSVVPLRAHVDDFLGAGYSTGIKPVVTRGGWNIDACFKRLYLSYNDCEMAVKYTLELRRKAKNGELPYHDDWHQNFQRIMQAQLTNAVQQNSLIERPVGARKTATEIRTLMELQSPQTQPKAGGGLLGGILGLFT